MEKIHNPERLAGESQLAYRERQKVSRAVSGRAAGVWNSKRQGTYVTPPLTVNPDGTTVAHTRKQMHSLMVVTQGQARARKEAEVLAKRTERANRERLGMTDSAPAFKASQPGLSMALATADLTRDIS